MNKYERQKEWEDALNMMTEDELYYIFAHPVGYYPSFLKMANAKAWNMMDDPYPIAENKAMMNAIVNIIEGLGSPCEIYDNEEISFCFKGADFSITFDKDFDYIEIIDNSWKNIDLNNFGLVERIKRAINGTNCRNSVTTAYIIDRGAKEMELYSYTSIPYFPNITYLKRFIEDKLYDLLGTHKLFDFHLKVEEEKEMENSFSQIISSEAN